MFSLFGQFCKEQLVIFLNNFNNYHPIIKYTREFDKGIISFLDLEISLPGGHFTTDLHLKIR